MNSDLIEKKFYFKVFIHFKEFIKENEINFSFFSNICVHIFRVVGIYEKNADEIVEDALLNDYLIIKKTSNTIREKNKRDKTEELYLIAVRTRSREECIKFAMDARNSLSMLKLKQVLEALSIAGAGSSLKYKKNNKVFYFYGREGTGKTYILEKIEEQARREKMSFSLASF